MVVEKNSNIQLPFNVKFSSKLEVIIETVSEYKIEIVMSQL